MSVYWTITWKATPRTDWRVITLSMKPRNWKQQDTLAHARYSNVYGWHHAPSRNWSTVTICTKVPYLDKGTDDDNTNQTRTLAMVCEQYPPEAWINVYTGGSATNAIRDSKLVLPFTSLAPAQKQPVQQNEDTTATTKQSQRHWCGLTIEEHH